MGTWRYEMEDLGFNYRLSDFQCALGLSQLRKVPAWVERRRKIAGQYDSALAEYSILMPLAVSSSVWHAYHLYVLQLVPHHPEVDQSGIFQFFREWGIGVNVHYLPVHLHPFYRSRFGTGPGLCPRAERAYERILSIPIFPAMTEEEVLHVIRVMGKAEKSWGR
jgi:perosamine synthetase